MMVESPGAWLLTVCMGITVASEVPFSGASREEQHSLEFLLAVLGFVGRGEETLLERVEPAGQLKCGKGFSAGG